MPRHHRIVQRQDAFGLSSGSLPDVGPLGLIYEEKRKCGFDSRSGGRVASCDARGVTMEADEVVSYTDRARDNVTGALITYSDEVAT